MLAAVAQSLPSWLRRRTPLLIRMGAHGRFVAVRERRQLIALRSIHKRTERDPPGRTRALLDGDRMLIRGTSGTHDPHNHVVSLVRTAVERRIRDSNTPAKPQFLAVGVARGVAPCEH